jgi:hypothetical protein
MFFFARAVIFFVILSSAGCAVAVRERPPEKAGKVAVCHKGKKTMYIADAAVKGHLGHGDYLGSCR